MFRGSVKSWGEDRTDEGGVGHGDVVVVHSRYDEVDNLVIEKEGQFHNRYGVFDHDELVGKPLGRRWVSSSGKLATGAGFVLALRPTPELWTLSLLHRTQIVYAHDIAVILMEMDLRPGCCVIEAGTGSGSMTVSLARAVAPTGRVISFEFHEKRAQKAAEDFKMLDVSDIVTVTYRDVVVEGFRGVPDSSIDAVFLDLPAVWDVVAEAERVLRPDGVLATFSPCIEQVEKTRESLRRHQFCEVKTSTVGLRSWDTRPRSGDIAAVDTEPMRKRKRESEGRGNKSGERKGIPDKTETVQRQEVSVLSKPYRETSSHTSYLTFARRVVDIVEAERVEEEEEESQPQQQKEEKEDLEESDLPHDKNRPQQPSPS